MADKEPRQVFPVTFFKNSQDSNVTDFKPHIQPADTATEIDAEDTDSPKEESAPELANLSRSSTEKNSSARMAPPPPPGQGQNPVTSVPAPSEQNNQ
jgi:hypothetical protein